MYDKDRIMIKIKKNIRKLVRKVGYDIVPLTSMHHVLMRRMKIIEFHKINTVLDIGANSGQYAQELREMCFKERIISFEPIRSAFNKLEEVSKSDKKWQVFNFALGDKNEDKKINIASNDAESSSFLDMLPKHLQAASQSKYIDDAIIPVKTIDSIWDNLEISKNDIYMKIDVQGFECQVLKGALKSLPYIPIVQMEMSIIPLYEKCILFEEILLIMKNYGYTLIALEPGYSDKTTGQLLQADGIFKQTHLLD